MRGGGISIALLCAAVAALFAAGTASACSCAPQAPSESLRESDAAVVGRLVGVVPRGPLHADYRYELQQVYRGRSLLRGRRSLTVRSARRAAACALPRRLGHSYGLFLARSGGRWFGGICGVVSPKRMQRAVRGRAAGSARAPVQTVLCG